MKKDRLQLGSNPWTLGQEAIVPQHQTNAGIRNTNDWTVEKTNKLFCEHFLTAQMESHIKEHSPWAERCK